MGFSIINWLAFAISFIAAPILTRVYSPNELGAITIFISVSTIFQVTTLCGQDQYLARRYYEEVDLTRQLITNIIIIVAMWTLTSLITIGLAKWLSIMIFGEINILGVVMCSIVSLPLSFIRMSQQLARMSNDIKTYGIQLLLFTFSTKIATIAVAFISKDYNAFILCYVVIVFSLGCLYGFYQFRKLKLKSLQNISFVDLKLSISYGLPIMISSILFVANDTIPRLILRSLGSMYAVGIYGAAVSLSGAINVIHSGFNTYFGAYFYENYSKDTGQINKIHHSLMFMLVSALILMCMFSLVIVKLLGDQYILAGSVFPFVMLMSIGNVVSETTVYGINLANKTYIHILISATVCCLAILLSYILIPLHDILGASMALGLSGFVFYILRTLSGQKYHRTINNTNRTVYGFIIAFLASFVNYAFYDQNIVKIGCEGILLTLIIVLYRDVLKEIIGIFAKVKPNDY